MLPDGTSFVRHPGQDKSFSVRLIYSGGTLGALFGWKAMLQLILMAIGVRYLYRWSNLDRDAAELNIDDPDALARWRFYRRRQYLLMIAAGWGIAVVSTVVAAAMSVPLTLLPAQSRSASLPFVLLSLYLVDIVGMATCFGISSNAGREADRIERGISATPGEQERFDKFASALSNPVKTGSLSNRRVKALDDAVVIYHACDLNSATFPSPPVRNGTPPRLVIDG